MSLTKTRPKRCHGGFAVATAGIAIGIVTVVADIPLTKADAASANEFRVCADPNNLPFSNQDEAGFENKLAELIATHLGKNLTYIWRPQRRAFVRTTLGSGDCDAILGVPANFDRVEPTHPYYRSTYVFVYKSDRHYRLSSIDDQQLRNLSIGVQLIGDDGYNTPPAHALSEQGIINNLVGYTVYGDYRQPNPPSRIIEAVENGTVDVAAVWGPLAGYFAHRSAVPLTVTPITDTEKFKPLLFQYDIAVGVRKGNQLLKSQIDDVLDRHRDEITRLLKEYSVPIVDADEVRSGSVN
jgi:mxaJ protein